MKIHARKTAPKVKNGVVQYKNNRELTPNIFNTPSRHPVFDKERPGPGFKHLIKKKDLYAFIALLPEWDELARGLNAVLLAKGGNEALGWYDTGVVAICAWDRQICLDGSGDTFYRHHARLLEKLGVPCERRGKKWQLDFTESTAKAFQLVHVFVHELGHHHDRMTTEFKLDCARGEGFAERYATEFEDEILRHYRDVFGLI